MSFQSIMRTLKIAPAMLGLALCGARLAAQEKPARPAADKGAAADLLAEKLHKQIDTLEAQREALRSDREQYSDRIIAMCGLSPENVKPVMLDLERELFTLNLGAKTKEVHARLLEKRVAEVATGTQELAAGDPIGVELEKIVAVRKEALKLLRVQRDAATIPANEVSKAEADLAEAEVRLALRKQEVTKPAGDGEREGLTRELRELSMAITLDEVRSKELDSRLGKLREARGMVDRFNDVANRIAALDREIDRGRALLLQIELGVPGVQTY